MTLKSRINIDDIYFAFYYSRHVSRAKGIESLRDDENGRPNLRTGPKHDRAELKSAEMRNQRETEREISKAIIRFEKEYMGRGPLETRSYIIDDLVLVRLKNVLTPAEMKLSELEERERGRYLIKQMRQELIERGRPLLDAVIKDILSVEVVSLHTDISAKTGERIIVFTLERRPSFAEA